MSMVPETDRADAFLADILAGPDDLAAVLAAHARAVAGLPAEALLRPRWRLIGMGSSRFADDVDAHVALPAAALDDPAVRLLVEPAVAELLAAELWRRTSAAESG